jgi:16S rRNA (cytosine967-C5)-methyltransferase
MTGVSAARKHAFQILMAVERGQAHSDALLRARGVSALAAADRNLTTALVLGVLRWQLLLDEAVRGLLARPNAKLDDEARVALRLGALQLMRMDRIPARAAIDESVELVKQAGHRFAAGMVNAVLRKLAAQTREEVPETTAAEIARKYAHPVWMVERWVQCYGLEAARAICAHGQRQPALSLRVRDEAAVLELEDAGVRLEPGALLAAARRVAAGDVIATAAYCEGRARVQDEGSQLVAELAGVASARAGQAAILDCCAAPGGKTLILAECNPLARIVACEASESRLKQMRERLEASSVRVEVRLADAAALQEDAAFDLVLADVPCSGTGTLGRNPEIRHRLRVEDLAHQAERQRAILQAALRAVRPGGRIVYSTCSLEPEENEQVVQAVIAERTDVRVTPAQERVQDLVARGIVREQAAAVLRGGETADGFLRLLPGTFDTDGFFVAVLERAR